MEEKKPGGAESAQQTFAVTVKTHPALTADREIQSQLAEFRKLEPEWIGYKEASAADTPAFTPDVINELNLWICPLSSGKPSADPGNDRCVITLSRGVMFGVSQADSSLRWARRIGVDSLVQPLSLAIDPARPPFAIVVSSAEKRLLVIDNATGQTKWAFPLPGACPAGPAQAGRRLFIPTVEGKDDNEGRLYVLELEAVGGGITGKLLGTYDLGQPLTMPGAYDPSSQRLYLPAERKRIYALDIARKQCAGVLYSEHTAGQLFDAPVAVDGILILAETERLDRTRIRVFNVGDKMVDEPIVEYAVAGWAWFPPYFDGRTLAYATDQGWLALFDVDKHSRQRVTPLAPALRLTDPPPIDGQPKPETAHGSRTLIVRAETE